MPPAEFKIGQTGAVLEPYRRLLAHPGALRFSLSGLIARLPVAMIGIGITLMVQQIYAGIPGIEPYTLAGTVSAVYVIVQAVASPQIARLVDRHGQARVMGPIILANAVFVSLLITATVLTSPIWLLYLCAAASGATFGSIGAMVRSRWTYLLRTEPREIHTAFSLEAAFDEIVFIIGPVVATFLATAAPSGADAQAYWPPAGVAVAVVISVVGGAIFLRQKSTEPPPVVEDQHERRRSVLRSGGLIVIAVVFIFVGGIFGATDISTVAMTKQLGQPSMAGVVLAVFAAGSCLSGFSYGLRTWVWPAWRRFALGVMLLGVGVCTFFLASSIPVLMAAMFVTGLAISPTLVTGNGMINDFVPKGRLTEGLTWAGTAMGFGVSVGSSVAGAMIDRHGYHAGFAVVVVCGVLTVLVTFAALPVLRRRAADAASREFEADATEQDANDTPADED